MTWTAEDELRLIELHKKGKTARNIAIILGKNRNSIIGKRHRLGLKTLKIKPKKEVEMSYKTAEKAVPLLLVKSNECRWPLGEKNDFCCGEPTARSSYCQNHADIAYVYTKRITSK